MTLEEALCWIDPNKRDPYVAELEYANGIDTADILVHKFNEAGSVVAQCIHRMEIELDTLHRLMDDHYKKSEEHKE